MKNKYFITGHFYELKGYKFRKFLNIRKNNNELNNPDLMVIMMNPGSSRPLDANEDYQIEIRAVPDKTQEQIMKIMNKCNFKFARILNLSDFREPKSSIFFDKIKMFRKNGIAHSIFDENRKDEFEKLFVKNIPVVFAWGVDKRLFELSSLAIKRIGKIKPYGWKKEGVEFGYYHPLPPNYYKQQEWVKKISEMIIKSP